MPESRATFERPKPDGPSQQALSSGAAPRRHAVLWVIILLSLIGLFGCVLVRTAWLSDDAYITLRTVDNFVHGHGLTWNPPERVQAYTHPLWMFLVSGVFGIANGLHLVGGVYYPAVFLAMAISLAAALLYGLVLARSLPQAVLGLTILLFSRAFVDYSTSGLENPLTHLLLILFFCLYLQDTPVGLKRLLWLSVVAGLGVLNRMDTILLFGPPLAYAWWSVRPAPADTSRGQTEHRPGKPRSSAPGAWAGPVRRRARALGTVALGFAPFIAWEIFSLIYYGQLLPNTAYAKLNTGLPAGHLARQGLYYLLDSIRSDPLTPAVIAAGLVAAAVSGRLCRIAVGLGMTLYLLYVVRIGGDFMSGRFLTAPLASAVALLGRLEGPARYRPAQWIGAMLAVLLVGLASRDVPLASGRDYGKDRTRCLHAHGIANERAFFYRTNGLLRPPLDPKIEEDPTARGLNARRQDIRVLVNHDILGKFAYYCGPGVHLIDPYALTDPLLARLPMIERPKWRIGHFERLVPDGYEESIRSGKNHLSDPDLRRLYGKLLLITHGPLFTWQRWRAIFELNTGQLARLVRPELYRHPPFRLFAFRLARPVAAGTPLDDPRLVPVEAAGIYLPFQRVIHARVLDVSLDTCHDHRIFFLRQDAEPVEIAVARRPAASPTLAPYEVEVPPSVVAAGFDSVFIAPVGDEGPCRLGHIRPR